MTIKNDVKFEEELTCHFKIDTRNLINFEEYKFGEKSTCRLKIGIRNLTNFDLSAQKSQRLSL